MNLSLGRNQPCADGIAHQAGNIVQVQLFHQLGAVALHRFDTDIQAPRNFLGGKMEPGLYWLFIKPGMV